MAINFSKDPEIFGLQVDDNIQYQLLQTMRWAKFVGILMAIITIFICLLTAFYFNFYMPQYLQASLPGSTAVLVSFATVLITIGLYFFPVFALLKFSAHINKAIKNSSQPHFATAIRYLKNLFKYIGILTIILIVVYAVIFIAGAMALHGAS